MSSTSEASLIVSLCIALEKQIPASALNSTLSEIPELSEIHLLALRVPEEEDGSRVLIAPQVSQPRSPNYVSVIDVEYCVRYDEQVAKICEILLRLDQNFVIIRESTRKKEHLGMAE